MLSQQAEGRGITFYILIEGDIYTVIYSFIALHFKKPKFGEVRASERAVTPQQDVFEATVSF